MDKTVRRGRVTGCVTPPSSKSYAQRAIAAALLAQGTTTLRGVELCDDTEAALDVIQTLGATVEKIDNHTYKIEGGLAPRTNLLNIGESGLSTRLFTPIASLCNTPITLTGHGSIMRRPVAMMTGPLEKLGVEVHCKDGLLPITVKGPLHGGEVEVDGTVSSQFITGLLTALPCAAEDTVIHVNTLNSKPYIDMTISTAASFGVDIVHRDYKEFFVSGGQKYKAVDYKIEGDWSGASCLLVAGAVAGEVTVNNLNPLSLQADKAIIDALTDAGAEITTDGDSVRVVSRELRAFEFDATDCPDLFPALATLAANCSGESVITGTNRLQSKESNRAETIASEFGKLGVEVDISEENVMRIRGGVPHGGTVDSHGDHRIAMTLAVLALNATEDVTITGAESVHKSYKDFWEDYDKITAYE
ncbi:MAG: 3-phosphoshikimate 1-carboxyvinyltransferase [Rikenellaceae bacterium]|nr:3-phosphoshikimate 1-carboxyvinyltransferase [Rikenellaceae bacterium]